jgi:hypothetical protein
LKVKDERGKEPPATMRRLLVFYFEMKENDGCGKAGFRHKKVVIEAKKET